jgi:sigma-B regulation protein RsbU (phosphoserine phosphatase)
MEQRKLYKTLDNILKQAPKYDKNEDLLKYVIQQIINSVDLHIQGGRLWKINQQKDGYRIIEQIGEVKPIAKNFSFKVKNYAQTQRFDKRRAFIDVETDSYLKSKGIHLYSAAGVGERIKTKIKINKTPEVVYLYPYLIAFNGKHVDEEFLNDLNIISVTISSVLKSRRIEDSAKENIVELEKASEIQKSILPEHEILFGDYDIFGISMPELIVGGDFFDYLNTGDDFKLSVAIADAASKGVSAAAQALYVSGALKMGVNYDVSMAGLIKKINDLVYDTFPNERFVTLFYCELYKDKRGLCVYVNAGHNAPFHYISKTGEVEALGSTGPVLGPSANQNYKTDSIYMDKDDILVLYTDGLVEAANSEFKFFGEEKLIEIIKKYKSMSAKEICQKILQDVITFNVNGKYSDDKTIVVIKKIKK